jgi:hypothetical protein
MKTRRIVWLLLMLNNLDALPALSGSEPDEPECPVDDQFAQALQQLPDYVDGRWHGESRSLKKIDYMNAQRKAKRNAAELAQYRTDATPLNDFVDEGMLRYGDMVDRGSSNTAHDVHSNQFRPFALISNGFNYIGIYIYRHI